MPRGLGGGRARIDESSEDTHRCRAITPLSLSLDVKWLPEQLIARPNISRCIILVCRYTC
jgi:hypothetical protein